jgi:transaldolase
MIESPLERLVKTHADMEIWWDSSPLVYKHWVNKMINAALPTRRANLQDQLARLFVTDDPARSLFRGCTTNPPLSWQAIQSDLDFWNAWVDELIQSHQGLAQNELAWLTYKEVVRRGAEMFLPIYESSNGRYGWISGQLDPRLFTETEQMVQDAEQLSGLSPNVMIKVPASMQGIEVVKILTSKGISTNTTVCFTLPQIMASARAAMEGVRLAEKNGVDISRWRAVITMMIGRLTENKALDVQAERRGLHMSRQEKHWFGIAVFRRAYRLIQENGYPSKMLACSLRYGPLVAGRMRFWDVEKLAGGAIVYTCPPYVLEPLFAFGDQLDFAPEIEKDDIPADVLSKMAKIPYCLQAYDPNGLELEQFNDHPATLDTVANFSKGFTGLEEFVRGRLDVLAVKGSMAPIH